MSQNATSGYSPVAAAQGKIHDCFRLPCSFHDRAVAMFEAMPSEGLVPDYDSC